MPHFDAIVIGSGQAGPSLTGRLTGAGKTVAFIEREHFGGTCVNDGCIPTKALVASAQAAHVARRAADFGVTISGADRRRHESASRRARTRIVGALAHQRRELGARHEGLHGLSRPRAFHRPKQVAVNGETLTADRIFINVGGRADRPANSGPRSGALSHQHVDDGCRFPAAPSDHARRQLHRA